MSSTTNTLDSSPNAIEQAYSQEIEHVRQVSDVKSDIDFTSIFANLIKKMDEGAQAAV